MKKLIFMLLFSFGVLVLVSACGSSENTDDNIDNETRTTFQATILENNKESLLVEPVEGEAELRSADKIIVSVKETIFLDNEGNEIEVDKFEKDMIVEIEYNGAMEESYPAQITSYQIKIVNEEV